LAVPAQLDGRAGPIDADLQDVSRTGVRIHVRTLALGFPPTLDLHSTAAMVAERLDEGVVLRLRHPLIGSPVAHRVRILRVALPADAPDSVELGCAFEVPLTVAESTILGGPLSPGADGDEAFCSRAEAPAPLLHAPARPEPTAAPAKPSRPHLLADGPPERVPTFVATSRTIYRAYLQGSADDALPPLVGRADQVSRDALRVRVARAGSAEESAAEATMRFTSTYGTRLRLKLMDGVRHVWTGSVRVCGIEMPAEHAQVLYVTLAFGRSLRPAERRRLGILTEVA